MIRCDFEANIDLDEIYLIPTIKVMFSSRTYLEIFWCFLFFQLYWCWTYQKLNKDNNYEPVSL